MNYDQYKRLEKQYADFLNRQPNFHSTKIQNNENGKLVLWINYTTGMPIYVKKRIATELGDIPLRFNEIKDQAL